MKRNICLIVCILAGILGLGCVLYPFVSNTLYEWRQDIIVTQYTEQMEDTDSELLEAARTEAKDYNRRLRSKTAVLTDPFDWSGQWADDEEYQACLNLNGDGLMGYLEIPSICVSLPIYHGTDGATLERGVGHLVQTSLPIGGESTHAVLTGHTGLNGKRLFTDLTELQEGDTFSVHILGDALTYEVDQIRVVEPHETELLAVEEGQDLVTLLTCTPYGVNTHRILVRGHRIETPETIGQAEESEANSTPRASTWKREYRNALCIGLLCAGGVVAVPVFVLWRKRR